MWLRKGDNPAVLVPERMDETIARCLRDGWVEVPDPRALSTREAVGTAQLDTEAQPPIAAVAEVEVVAVVEPELPPLPEPVPLRPAPPSRVSYQQRGGRR